MKFIIAFLIGVMGITSVSAGTMEMFGHEKYGYSQPKYIKAEKKGKKKVKINVLGENNLFPLSSVEQGSIFSLIFDEALNSYPIDITIGYNNTDYESIIRKFERGERSEILGNTNAYFSYYKEMPYFNNKFLYPAFFSNNVHIITTQQNRLNLKNKNELKNYKGIYAKTDKMADFVIKDFNFLNITETEDLPKAFELLLTGQADYIAANYYPSQIEAYKLGIHDFLAFSSEAVWKQPVFLRVEPKLLRSPLIKELQKVLSSSNYEKIRDKAFDNLLDVYRENTQGIVPPTYTRVEEETTETDSSVKE